MSSLAADREVVERVSTGYRPRPWQLDCHQAFKRFNVLVVHRRGGKTTMAVNSLIDGACRCDKPRGRFAYFAPFQNQAREICWDIIKDHTRPISGATPNETTMNVEFPNGAKLKVFGADKPDSFRGQGFDGIVLDEVADMRPGIWSKVLRPALSDRHGWAIFIGTPKGINLFSNIYFKALTKPSWFTALYTYKDTDALSPEEIEANREELTEEEFAQEFLCDFHADVENAVILIKHVKAAMERVYTSTAFDYAPRIMGVDVAWQGGDRSAIAKRQGVQAFGHVTLRNTKPMDLASRVCQEADDFKPTAIFIDIGYAPGVCNRVIDLGYPAIGVDFGGRPSEPRFENKRAEMWWALREWVEVGSLPSDDNEIIGDFCAPLYTMKNRRGRIQLESKDEIRKRVKKSPDLGDAYALTFAEPVEPAGFRGEEFDRETYDYDPY